MGLPTKGSAICCCPRSRGLTSPPRQSLLETGAHPPFARRFAVDLAHSGPNSSPKPSLPETGAFHNLLRGLRLSSFTRSEPLRLDDLFR